MVDFFNSMEKSLARLHVHRSVKDLWDIAGVTTGKVVTLAGYNAGDVGCLKHVLNLRPERVVLVDTDMTGLRIARSKWPGVQTHTGDVLYAIRELNDGIAFANLDFTGILSDHQMKVFKEVGKNLLPGGVVSYTFMRGRDNARTRGGKMIRELANHENSEDQRTAAYVRAVISSAGHDLRPTFLLRYDSGRVEGAGSHAPMGILGFQKVTSTAKWESYVKSSSRTKKLETRNIEPELRSAILALRKAGKTSSEISEILHPGPCQSRNL